MIKTSTNYNDKIKTIMGYFGVSKQAAKYIFHRRRRGFPWKKSGDVNYLQWSIQIQNALVLAGSLKEFKWDVLKFNDEIQTLLDHDIIIADQPESIQINKTDSFKDESFDDGWTVVKKRKPLLVQKHILKDIGLIPRHKN
jgi:hypothetical protein